MALLSARLLLFVLGHYVVLFTVWGFFSSAAQLPQPIAPCLCPPAICPPCRGAVEPVPALEVTRTADGRFCFTEHHILEHFKFNVSALIARGGVDERERLEQRVLV